MALRLFDSLTREIRELKPSQGDGVLRFYNCGPTVYAAAHIGNFRTFVINNFLFWRHLFDPGFFPKINSPDTDSPPASTIQYFGMPYAA